MNRCTGSYDSNTDGNVSECTRFNGCGLEGCPDLQARQMRQNKDLGEAIAKTYHAQPKPAARFFEIESLRASGHTRRWHTFPHLGDSQTVAEHSGQAVSLLLLLHPSPSVSLIKALMWHDTAERIAGDVPAPIRRMNPDFAEHYELVEAKIHDEHHPSVARAMASLTIEELTWLKAIDVLELVMHCHDMWMLGNRHALIVRDRGVGYLENERKTPPIVLEFLNHYLTQDGGPRSFA